MLSTSSLKLFLAQKQGATKNEMLSRALEHPALKDAAANLTTLPDELLEDVIADQHPGM
jgi:hypothetical protein